MIAEYEKQKEKIDELLSEMLDSQMKIDTLSAREKESERFKEDLSLKENKS